MIDLVYFVKNSDDNQALKYSLRSIEKFAPEYGNIWIVGYKPKWVQGVNYIHTKQTKTPLENVGDGLIEVCNCPDISEDFILMNDDFILTSPLKSWNKDLISKCKLSDQLTMYDPKSYYYHAVDMTLGLMELLTGTPDGNSFEMHAPMVINKEKYKTIIEAPIIADYIKDNSTLMWRSVYGNMICGNPTLAEDVKIYNDTLPKTQWISLTKDFRTMPVLLTWLKENLPACKFEVK